MKHVTCGEISSVFSLGLTQTAASLDWLAAHTYGSGPDGCLSSAARGSQVNMIKSRVAHSSSNSLG